MLCICSEPGCGALTMGGPCVVHDSAARPVFVRGRPFSAAAVIKIAKPIATRGLAGVGVAYR